MRIVFNVVQTLINPNNENDVITKVLSTNFTELGAKFFLANYLELSLDDDVLNDKYIYNDGDGTNEHDNWRVYYMIVPSKICFPSFSEIPDIGFTYEINGYYTDTTSTVEFSYYTDKILTVDVGKMALCYIHEFASDVYYTLVYFGKLNEEE